MTSNDLGEFCQLVANQLVRALPPSWYGWTEAERRYYLAQLDNFWFVRWKDQFNTLGQVTFEVTACQYLVTRSVTLPPIRIPWDASSMDWERLPPMLREAVDAVVVLIVDEFKAEKAPLRSRVDRVLDDESPPPPQKSIVASWVASERAAIQATGTSILDRILQGQGL